MRNDIDRADSLKSSHLSEDNRAQPEERHEGSKKRFQLKLKLVQSISVLQKRLTVVMSSK
jgi:hypothetical protein